MKRKLYAGAIFLIFVVLAISMTLRTYFYRELTSDNEFNNLKKISELVNARYDTSEDIRAEMADFATTLKLHIEILDRFGRVSFQSGVIPVKKTLPKVQLAEDHVTRALLRSNNSDLDILVYAEYFPKTERFVRIFQFSTFPAMDRSIHREFILTFLISTLFAIVLVAGYVYYLRSPYEQFSDVFKELTLGNYNKRLYIRSKDEIGTLSDRANEALERIDFTNERLTQSLVQAEGIVSSIPTGVIAIDSRKLIFRANRLAGRMLGFDPDRALQRHFVEVVRRSDLEDAVNKVLKPGKRNQILTLQVKLKNLEVRVQVSPIFDRGDKIGAVVILEDVTEESRLQDMRRDFVSNVSHELKTPLTSIKGFTETLLSMQVDEVRQRRFLSIIDGEVDRLNSLVSDLLVLSEIEKDERSNANKEYFNPYLEVDRSKEFLLVSVEDKENLEINFNDTMEDAHIYGNKRLFKQLVINLVGNAIKYSKKEGGVIDVLCEEENDQFILRVKDQGVGISKEDLPRIFERFYRADKSRSLDVEGTGLGLAIVKHIVISFNGQIGVHSKLGEGSEFFVSIPLVSLHGINNATTRG
ncbi:ATP-binding protein [Guggenheimella bovis]